MNKYKIINDPVYGFVNIPTELVFDIVSHPYFQRLRRISQMGLASLVYPGATHTRFHHALGAMHLMQQALEVLISKGHHITELEIESACVAILLHDIGHGPFSHTLEATILQGVHHEEVSLKIFNLLNQEFDGRLTKAIEIFKGTYPKNFLHQLISGQLDVDRMDYLNRDSFYSGVVEGVIGYDRIIKMLDVYEDQLVVEEKGMYSVEKFIVSRRLMYWQVYLHKTSIAADHMLKNVLKRAKYLYQSGDKNLNLPDYLEYFFQNNVTKTAFAHHNEHAYQFVKLDDYDIVSALKSWMHHKDSVLSYISESLINRNLFKILYLDSKDNGDLQSMQSEFYVKHPELRGAEAYLFDVDSVKNDAYIPGRDSIFIKMKDGQIKNFVDVAEVLTIKSLSNTMVKHYICHPA